MVIVCCTRLLRILDIIPAPVTQTPAGIEWNLKSVVAQLEPREGHIAEAVDVEQTRLVLGGVEGAGAVDDRLLTR